MELGSSVWLLSVNILVVSLLGMDTPKQFSKENKQNNERENRADPDNLGS